MKSVHSKKSFLSLHRENILRFKKTEPVVFYSLVITFFVALFFRTYDYFNRIYVYADNALFVQIAYYANKTFSIPQIGPFAQAPFFTGPWWLWILQIIMIIPLGILTPWYFMTLFSFVFIWLMYIAGREIGGKYLGLLSAFLTAISTAQIDNSFMTWNADADSYFGLFAILFLLFFHKTNRPLYMFLLGFAISLGTTIHFQTSLIAPIILVALFTTKPNLKSIFALLIGGLIPLLPFLYFDVRFHWFETRRIIDYVIIGQHRIYVPNRWLTYAGVFWPETWAWMIGGHKTIGGILIGLVSTMSLLKLKEFKKHFKYFLVAVSFFLTVVAFRYYKGERLFYYTNVMHPFVILLTAWTLHELFKFKRLLGILVTLVVIGFSLQASLQNFKPRAVTYQQVQAFKQEIYDAYPGANFAIYECPFSGSIISTPVSYLMYYEGRNTLDGVKIGVCNESLNLTWREVGPDEIDKEYHYQNKSTPHIYADVTEWWKVRPPGESLY